MAEERLDQIIKRLDILEKDMKRVSNRLQCRVKKEELKLSEKLDIHDHAKNLEAHFEDWMRRAKSLEIQEIQIRSETSVQLEKELGDIIKYLVALVDNALGVKP